MKKLLSLLVLFASCTSGLSAEGRVSINMSWWSQANLWAEDLFVTRKHRGADYFDIFAPDTFFVSAHGSKTAPEQRQREGVRIGVLGYQATIKSGWYFGITPSAGLRPQVSPGGSFTFSFDPGIALGKQFTRGSLLAKAEAFYQNGTGVRGALQYPLVASKYGSIAANHTARLGSFPQSTRLFLARHPLNIPERYACDLFNGIRFWLGHASLGLGHHCGIERQISLTPFLQSLTEWDAAKTRSVGQRNEEKAEKQHAVLSGNMPRIAIVHDVIGDLTFAWEHLRLSMYASINLTEERGSSGGLRVSYHF